MADLRGITDMSRTKYLVDRFELDPSGSLKRMPLGMKRKLAIVAAFMHDPRVLVLDEPTSSLDPLMQESFVAFIHEEKQRGKTILMSSHIFAEVDSTCDRIAIIKDGRLVSTFVTKDLKHAQSKTYKLEFNSGEQYQRFIKESLEFASLSEEKKQVKVIVADRDISAFIATVSKYDLKFFSEIKFTLEDHFMRFYRQDQKVARGDN